MNRLQAWQRIAIAHATRFRIGVDFALGAQAQLAQCARATKEVHVFGGSDHAAASALFSYLFVVKLAYVKSPRVNVERSPVHKAVAVECRSQPTNVANGITYERAEEQEIICADDESTLEVHSSKV